MTPHTDWEKLKTDFWNRVVEVEPSDIKSETIKVVCDKDIEWLISHAVAERMEEIRKLVEKDRPMFFRNNIVELMQLENIKKVRKQLRKEILDDISSLTPPATEEKENL